MSIDRLRQQYALHINWIQFPLHPDTPAEGMLITDLFPGRDLRPMQERMRGLMREAGLPYGSRTHTYNSRLAQELGKWADSLGDPQRADALHRALFHAYFFDGVNIGKPDHLLEIAAGAGLDQSEARRVLTERLFSEAVDADWQQARSNGITGVPTFMHGDLMVVGCQPYEVLARFVEHVRDQAH